MLLEEPKNKKHGTKAASAKNSGTQVSAVTAARVRGARRRRRNAVDLWRDSESGRQFDVCVAGHDARVESVMLKAASGACSSRSSALDRLRLLTEKVAVKYVAGLACTSEGHSGCGGPSAPSGMLVDGAPLLLRSPAEQTVRGAARGVPARAVFERSRTFAACFEKRVMLWAR